MPLKDKQMFTVLSLANWLKIFIQNDT